ncbi:heterokaryon incompatibility protein-domain-containing protein [Bisporella sp. PMI_857]|nr:heterokaryon incompatibility protein-domain-containing protein [Bisporella sp. PMI_857]
MAFVQKLGERYLWVDAFCIIQDNAESKHEDIRYMDQIYSQAYATIVALTGVDANSGLSGIRPGSRRHQEYERVGKSTIFTTPPILPHVLDTSPWMTRGWTFQEKLLSRQCLYFSDEYVYLQCGTIVSSEAGVNLPAEWEENSTGNFNSLVDLIPNAPSWNLRLIQIW